MAETPTNGDLNALLLYLRDQRGFDFTGYKRASLSRRINKRMQAVGAADYQAYLALLEANPGEFSDLFNTILINVTGFLRDREAWDYVSASVLPEIIGRKGPTDPVRVWSAGCASGEEAYSLAVLLAEALGEERFRRSVKIYATDADEDALTYARHARYTERVLTQAFGAERVKRFFELDGGTGVFRQDLRNSLIFGRHDLIQDPPISRIDLLVCRNTLMYFTADAQRRILTSFHFALTHGGYLFLGKSEALVRRTDLFQSVDNRQHVFRKDGRTRHERLAYSVSLPTRAFQGARDDTWRYAEAAFELSPTAQMVVNRAGVLILTNRHARALFGIGSADVGRPLRDLEVSHRPIDLRSPVDQVLRDRRPVMIGDVPLDPEGGDGQYLDFHLTPMADASGVNAVGITVLEVGRFKLLRDELERSQGELESAYEELQSAVEELETTNEELQSTNEELENTNEELRVRTGQLDEVNQFLQSVLSGLQSGVVVVNPELQVREWSQQAEELWGLRADEVDGRHFLNLDIGLPVDRLRTPIRSVLADGSVRHQLTVPAVNRRGRAITCAVTVSPLMAEGAVVGAILLMDVLPPQEAVVGPDDRS
ncbi:MAG TPA: CheR family methyltransferase [Acidimicrobiales bacterium]|nr:CheR family methyltransferase [Acidimicrobiales bacterium]